ncbi:hypothetical protein GUITHDRAFT_146551 [Guillardia theta CCMP2712]|uniref:Uncharacterized protein n=1 Tax=Guillardia theta (strain CCMP2712) TaxID=905079 RepID=L1IHG6_GUITC|nr:hypothetical protein GUITHDRAFT_146551 [Guillardia theta CCMP2712]EKX35349.1 hypothetical protein GUITHDRAFT_146551 [Guillardia theta CCMP2712]|eukprot:XP_005822329.1 hypothetical protein GUITHDRAFT_146551 [Guillardia theta CCMP2712]
MASRWSVWLVVAAIMAGVGTSPRHQAYGHVAAIKSMVLPNMFLRGGSDSSSMSAGRKRTISSCLPRVHAIAESSFESEVSLDHLPYERYGMTVPENEHMLKPTKDAKLDAINADPYIGKWGWTGIHRAAVLVNKTTHTGWSALHFAAGSGHLEMVKLLVKLGVDKNWRDSYGDLPIDKALRNAQQRFPSLPVRAPPSFNTTEKKEVYYEVAKYLNDGKDTDEVSTHPFSLEESTHTTLGSM